MDLGSNAGLIVATLDLQLVRLLRDAAGGTTAVTDLGPAPNRLNTAARAAVRPVIQPEPRIEPRLVHHPEPRIEPRPVVEVETKSHRLPTQPTPAEPERFVTYRPAVRPPWRIPPQENPPQAAPVVKVVQIRPDIVHKGSLIDFFI